MFLCVNIKKVISITILVLIVMLILSIYSKVVITTSSSEKKLLPIYNVEMEEKKIALTVNCAWDNNDIDDILSTFKKYNIKITFFVVGDWVKKYPDSLKKIYEEGHEIANHSNSHPHVNNLSVEKNSEQIEKCRQEVYNIIGINTKLYRGPYGEYNNNVIKSAKQNNHQTIQWNIDTLDYKGLTKEEMWKRIESKLSPGSIVLMHSGAKNTAKSLSYIIDNLLKLDYQIVKVGDMIYKENFYIDVNGIQKLIN